MFEISVKQHLKWDASPKYTIRVDCDNYYYGLGICQYHDHCLIYYCNLLITITYEDKEFGCFYIPIVSTQKRIKIIQKQNIIVFFNWSFCLFIIVQLKLYKNSIYAKIERNPFKIDLEDEANNKRWNYVMKITPRFKYLILQCI